MEEVCYLYMCMCTGVAGVALYIYIFLCKKFVMIGKSQRTSFQLIISGFYSNKILCHIPRALMIHLWRKLSVSHMQYDIVTE